MPDLPSGTVTFVFTDLVVSTRLWEQERDAMSTALARHDEILRDAIAAHGGQVVKGRGDGVHAVFPTAAGAVRAAIDGQLSLGSETWPVSEPLLVRVGIHTGVAELRDDDYFGPAVNRAARLEGIAHGGQIVVSHATEALVRDELGDDVELVDLGEHRLRDLSRAERVFQVRAAGLVDAFPTLRSLDTFPSNLPAQLTSFVGRDEELAALAKALDESRLVTLTGVGGVGKTRLALRLAAELLPRFADGAWLCELATTNDPDALGQVIVAELSVQPRPGRSLLESACDYLSGKQALIVLDNCEHLLDAAAEVADAILHAAPGVRVVATSRELLGVPGERVVGVRSLRLPSESGVAGDRGMRGGAAVRRSRRGDPVGLLHRRHQRRSDPRDLHAPRRHPVGGGAGGGARHEHGAERDRRAARRAVPAAHRRASPRHRAAADAARHRRVVVLVARRA